MTSADHLATAADLLSEALTEMDAAIAALLLEDWRQTTSLLTRRDALQLAHQCAQDAVRWLDTGVERRSQPPFLPTQVPDLFIDELVL